MPSFWAKCDIVTPPTEKWAFFRTFSRPPPPGGETCEILLANYKGPPMPFHYLYNWLLPLARFRKSRPDKNRYRKKKKKKEKVYICKTYVAAPIGLRPISAATKKMKNNMKQVMKWNVTYGKIQIELELVAVKKSIEVCM